MAVPDRSDAAGAFAPIDSVDVGAFTVPTEQPESDGTLNELSRMRSADRD
jgi:hypothetical protein